MRVALCKVLHMIDQKFRIREQRPQLTGMISLSEHVTTCFLIVQRHWRESWNVMLLRWKGGNVSRGRNENECRILRIVLIAHMKHFKRKPDNSELLFWLTSSTSLLRTRQC